MLAAVSRRRRNGQKISPRLRASRAQDGFGDPMPWSAAKSTASTSTDFSVGTAATFAVAEVENVSHESRRVSRVDGLLHRHGDRDRIYSDAFERRLARVGITEGCLCARESLAESVRRTRDRLHSTRVPRSRHRPQRGASPAGPRRLPPVLFSGVERTSALTRTRQITDRSVQRLQDQSSRFPRSEVSTIATSGAQRKRPACSHLHIGALSAGTLASETASRSSMQRPTGGGTASHAKRTLRVPPCRISSSARGLATVIRDLFWRTTTVRASEPKPTGWVPRGIARRIPPGLTPLVGGYASG